MKGKEVALTVAEVTREISYADAGVEALREEMLRDETIIYLGQGIGPRGGNFRQTRGLWNEFGDERLRDTPICELSATGMNRSGGMLPRAGSFQRASASKPTTLSLLRSMTG